LAGADVGLAASTCCLVTVFFANAGLLVATGFLVLNAPVKLAFVLSTLVTGLVKDVALFSNPVAVDTAPKPVPTVDAHAHLEIVTDAAPDSDAVRKVLDDAKAAGVDRVVQVGYSAEQSKWCVAAAEHFDDRVLAAVALHPNEAPVVADMEADLKIIEELAAHSQLIGNCKLIGILCTIQIVNELLMKITIKSGSCG
jgi:uncharacterized iron-regulated membrane protein